jgi:hypothetical protein
MTAELRWFKRLQKVLRDMPATVEISVHNGNLVCMHERGAGRRYFDEVGDLDNVPEKASFVASDIRPCGESL